MKTKKVLILILLIILAISSTACVDKDSVEYIYNIRRFVGEYENKRPGIFIGMVNIDNQDKGESYFSAYVNREITTSGYYDADRDGGTHFVEKEFTSKDVEFFNKFINVLGQSMIVKRTKIKFPTSNSDFEITKKTLPPKDEVDNNDIYSYELFVEMDLGLNSNTMIIFGYSKSKEPFAELVVSKETLNEDGSNRRLSVALHYKIK